MSIEAAIYTRLTTDAAVAALIGDRVFPNAVPQGSEYPAIDYEQTSGIRDQVMDGPTGLVSSIFDIRCKGKTYIETRTLADAVRARLDGFAGTIDGQIISSASVTDEYDEPVISPGDRENRIFTKLLQFTIWFKE